MNIVRFPLRLVSGAAVLALGTAVSMSAHAAGTLRYATVGEPPSLDQHVVTSDLATTIAHHMFEGLYTFDANYDPQPLLASGEEVAEDGSTITIHLRDDVVFHDGQPMTSEDVVASLKRWGEHGSRGKLLFANISDVAASGSHAVTLSFTSPFGPWKNLMAFINGGPAIYPARIAAGAGSDPIDVADYVGTGPYMFSEWRPNRYVELVRFDDYRSPPGDASGYAGQKVAHFDTLHFIPVPDPGTRVNGVRAGDYDYAESMPSDLIDELDMDSETSVVLNGGPIFGLVFMNSRAGPLMENFTLRQAIQAALNKEDALRVSIGRQSCGAPTALSFLKETPGTRHPARTASARVMPRRQAPWPKMPGMTARRSSFWSPRTMHSITIRPSSLPASCWMPGSTSSSLSSTGRRSSRSVHSRKNGTCSSRITDSCRIRS